MQTPYNYSSLPSQSGNGLRKKIHKQMGMPMVQNASEAEIRGAWNIPVSQNVIVLLIFF